MQESDFQRNLKKDIKKMFPDAVVMKTDPRQIQGMPDLLILYKNKWACLECKRSTDAHRQQHQDYYVNKYDEMSFARFISPENKKEVLDELQQAFES